MVVEQRQMTVGANDSNPRITQLVEHHFGGLDNKLPWKNQWRKHVLGEWVTIAAGIVCLLSPSLLFKLLR